MNGKQINNQLINATSFSAEGLVEGRNVVAIDVKYTGKGIVGGSEQEFIYDPTGITAINPDETDSPTYDIQGRNIILDTNSRGVFIRNNKKILR